MRRLWLLIALALIAAACGAGDDDPTVGEAGLEAVAPLEADVGSVPRFEWKSIDGAASYRLAVLGPNGPIWAWEGEDTSVNLGGLSGERPELMPGPVVVPGTSWSVAAIDASGRVLDVVGPITISAGGNSDPDPDESASTAPLTAEELPDPCTLVEQDDVDDLFGGPSPTAKSRNVTGPGDSVAGRSCSWSRVAAASVSVFLETRFLTPMEICDFCEPIEGLGDEAWGGESDRGSGGAMLAIVQGELGIQLRADGLGATVEQLQQMATTVLAGLG